MNRFAMALAGLALIQAATGTAQAPNKPKPDPKKIPPRLVEILKSSPDDFIKRFDKNRDGMLTKDELPPFLAKNFDKMDTNGDGQLDRAEVARMLQVFRKRFGLDAKAPAAPKPPNSALVDKMVNSLLQKFDTNNDGKISKEEAKGFLAQNFARFDLNKDGFLDRSELRKLAVQMSAKGPKGEKPQPAPSRPDFDALDANADGRLTRDELKGSPLLKHFDEIDTNRDGRIDRREFEAYLKKQEKSPP